MVVIHGKEYMEVNERLRIFREKYPNWALLTEIHTMTDTRVVFKATILDDKGVRQAIGHAFEDKDSSNINKTSFIENCETSAWGRALANLGIGINTAVASSDEVEQAIEQQEKLPDAKPEGEMSVKQWKFILALGVEKQLSQDEVIELVKWKADELGVEPRHWKVAKAMIPKENFEGVLDSYLDWRNAEDTPY